MYISIFSQYGLGLGLKRADPVRLRQVFEKVRPLEPCNELIIVTSVWVKVYISGSLFEQLPLLHLHQYADVVEDGELYMKADVFVRKYLGLYAEDDYNPSAVKLIAGVVDTSKDGLVSFMEFQAFEALLCSPDALYRTAFQVSIH